MKNQCKSSNPISNPGNPLHRLPNPNIFKSNKKDAGKYFSKIFWIFFCLLTTALPPPCVNAGGQGLGSLKS
jgi:hypothetical protein